MGCSSGSGSHACVDVSGTYELTVTPTGQSENDQGFCAVSAMSTTEGVVIAGDVASIAGENCQVTSTSGCQILIDCEGDSGADAAVSPTFVQSATFVLPTSGGAPTSNALVELGASYCGFEGTATRQP
jgi:hypothetical protein